jgi:hypothetical protein
MFIDVGCSNIQVSSATATFVMLFSASMSVVEYSLLGRLPRDQGAYCTSQHFSLFINFSLFNVKLSVSFAQKNMT